MIKRSIHQINEENNKKIEKILRKYHFILNANETNEGRIKCYEIIEDCCFSLLPESWRFVQAKIYAKGLFVNENIIKVANTTSSFADQVNKIYKFKKKNSDYQINAIIYSCPTNNYDDITGEILNYSLLEKTLVKENVLWDFLGCLKEMQDLLHQIRWQTYMS